MSSAVPSSAIHFPFEDDRDLDDAELWAVIDSAAASLSSRPRKPVLALKNSYSPAQAPSPAPSKIPRNHRPQIAPAEDGEVVQREEWMACQRPHKMARVGDHGMSVTDHRMVVVRHQQRAPVVASSSCSSPDMGKFMVKEVSPVVESPPSDYRRGEEQNNRVNCLSGRFPSVSMFKDYQNSAMAILEKSDYTMISGSPYIKKSGWRKISCFFNISFEIRDKSIEFDENRNVQRAEFVARALMQGGRFSDGWGSCERREKRFLKPNHDIPSTAETRAKNKACQDLLGIGEYRPGAVSNY
ncbi:hypothetical protein IHE45_07G125400 [Dioscorea alata]|uniref:Uncharacterized protein n=1 Tax=Dioscorea alata TaxID=55571 RepID=A0ACB7VUH3_DIOAL|nr:hypothetical protein IHE45_07G125400 [Dioscorea alata]